MDNKSATPFLNRDFIYTVPESILFDSDLTLNDLKLYMIVRSFMDTTGSAYPSNNWIASKLGVDRSTAIRCLNRLIKKNYLVKIEKNNHRYLTTFQSICSQEVVAPTPPPSGTSATPPSGMNATQLVSNISSSKIIGKDTSGSSSSTAFAVDYEYQETLYQAPDKPSSIKALTTQDLLQNNPHNIPENLLEEWQLIRKGKRAPLTDTVWTRLNKTLSKLRDPIDAFEIMIAGGWVTIQQECWINNARNEKPNKKDEVTEAINKGNENSNWALSYKTSLLRRSR